jgi:5-methylcytosine-specific restriction endonuclease McrA
MSDSNFTSAMKQWKAKNPEKVREQKARWYARHKEEIAAKTAARIAADPEKKKAWNAKWREENAARKKEYESQYHAANRDKHKIRMTNRRAREAGGKLSADLEAKLFQLQRGKCACCGEPLGDDYHLDHVMPLALGGTNTDDNIQLLRDKCNRQKHAKHPVDFMQERGFLI